MYSHWPVVLMLQGDATTGSYGIQRKLLCKPETRSTALEEPVASSDSPLQPESPPRPVGPVGPSRELPSQLVEM